MQEDAAACLARIYQLKNPLELYYGTAIRMVHPNESVAIISGQTALVSCAVSLLKSRIIFTDDSLGSILSASSKLQVQVNC